MTHNVLSQCVADCDSATLHYVHPGGTVGSIASNYAHIVFAEDRLINPGGARRLDGLRVAGVGRQAQRARPLNGRWA